MRIGNTFSRALDPAKPLLFGDLPLGVLKEEIWHPTAARLSLQDPLSSTQRTSASGDPSTDPGADSSTNEDLGQ